MRENNQILRTYISVHQKLKKIIIFPIQVYTRKLLFSQFKFTTQDIISLHLRVIRNFLREAQLKSQSNREG